MTPAPARSFRYRLTTRLEGINNRLFGSGCGEAAHRAAHDRQVDSVRIDLEEPT